MLQHRQRVAPTDVTLPFADADYPERYEGMLVRLPQSLVIAEYFNYDRFGEIVLAQAAGRRATAVHRHGDRRARARRRTPARWRTASAGSRSTTTRAPRTRPSCAIPNGQPFSLANTFRGGDIVENTVGVLGFDFSLYRIYPTAGADYMATNPRPAAPEHRWAARSVSRRMNTLNFFVTLDTTANDTGPRPVRRQRNLDCRGADADQPAEFTRQRDKLLAALTGLNGDIIGLNELENTTGCRAARRASSAGLPGTTTSTPARSAPTRSRSA